MANNNSILPFGNAGGANTISDASYLALAARLSGFVQGVAPSAQLNKVWKQSALISSVIAQFTADYGPSDVTDALSVSALETQFLAALRAAVTTTQSPTIPYEGTDTGATPNAVFVNTTIPALPVSLAAGQIYLINKGSLANTGAITIKFGANAPIPAKMIDGDLIANDWPAFQPAWVYLVSLAGTLTGVVLTSPRLNFPGLTEQDAIVAPDIFAYYDISAQAHVKIPFNILAAAILAGFASQAGSALLLNPQVIHLEERRSQNTAPTLFPQNNGGVLWTPRPLNTVVSNQVTGATFNTSNSRLTLPQGSYRAWWNGQGHGAGFHVTRIYDYQNGILIAQGATCDSYVSQTEFNNTTNGSGGVTRFVVGAGGAIIGLDHFGSQNPSGQTLMAYTGDNSTGFIPFTDAYLHLEKENGV